MNPTGLSIKIKLQVKKKRFAGNHTFEKLFLRFLSFILRSYLRLSFSSVGAEYERRNPLIHNYFQDSQKKTERIEIGL